MPSSDIYRISDGSLPQTKRKVTKQIAFHQRALNHEKAFAQKIEHFHVPENFYQTVIFLMIAAREKKTFNGIQWWKKTTKLIVKNGSEWAIDESHHATFGFGKCTIIASPFNFLPYFNKRHLRNDPKDWHNTSEACPTVCTLSHVPWTTLCNLNRHGHGPSLTKGLARQGA